MRYISHRLRYDNRDIGQIGTIDTPLVGCPGLASAPMTYLPSVALE